MDVTHRGPQDCSWEGCNSPSDSMTTMSEHLQAHAANARTIWTRGSRCKWEGCKSKATFNTPTKYNYHLENIHTKPLLCTVSGCSFKKPFRNYEDRERHNITAHSATPKMYECPYEFCESSIKTFARKDKWLKHIREVQHINDAFCPYSHCNSPRTKIPGGFRDREAISSHFSYNHAHFQNEGLECGLASCAALEGNDSWSEIRLQFHLRNDHGIWGTSVYYTCRIMSNEGRFVFMVDDLACMAKNPQIWGGEPVDIKWHDCSSCAPTNSPRKFITKASSLSS